jgi:hypothetical protein
MCFDTVVGLAWPYDPEMCKFCSDKCALPGTDLHKCSALHIFHVSLEIEIVHKRKLETEFKLV